MNIERALNVQNFNKKYLNSKYIQISSYRRKNIQYYHKSLYVWGRGTAVANGFLSHSEILSVHRLVRGMCLLLEFRLLDASAPTIERESLRRTDGMGNQRILCG